MIEELLHSLDIIEASHKHSGMSGATLFSVEGVQFGVHWKSKTIGFPGTNEDKDWFRNLDTSLVKNDWGSGRVHQGFKRYTEIAFPHLFDAIKHQEGWTFAGYSLGAPLAYLSALRYSNQGGNVKKVFYIAGPKCCDGTCVKQNPLDVTRVVVNGDPVPWFPVGNLLPPRLYRHFPNVLKLGKNKLWNFVHHLHDFPSYRSALEAEGEKV